MMVVLMMVMTKMVMTIKKVVDVELRGDQIMFE